MSTNENKLVLDSLFEDEGESATSAAELENELGETLNDIPAERLGIWNLSTFADAGVMTRDKGFVLKLDDGAEFQITIVKTR
jgi:hypothetical protein